MKNPDHLHFGTAGVPIRLSGKDRTTEHGIRDVHKLGLDAMELEFVHSVNISKEKAPTIQSVAEKEGVLLTCHGQYFINLNAHEPAKMHASINRILSAARIASLCGAWSMTFHAAYYLGDTSAITSNVVKTNMKNILKTLRDEGHTIWIRPETTGKGSQWGTLPEIIKLSQDIEGVMPCVDFSHLHARSGGKENTLAEFRAQLTLLEKGLGKMGLTNMHIHTSGINYTDKGERNHLLLDESDMNYKDLTKVWKEFNIKGAVISESPIMEKDALILKMAYERAS